MESIFLIGVDCFGLKFALHYDILNIMEAYDSFLANFSKIEHILERGAKFACTGRQNIEHGIRTGRQNRKTGSVCCEPFSTENKLITVFNPCPLHVLMNSIH